jgi:periplasmic nitrate reductase NapE
MDARSEPRQRETDHAPTGWGREFLVFLLLAVVLAPVLAVMIVGGYGFLVWISHMVYGPPGPPGV